MKSIEFWFALSGCLMISSALHADQPPYKITDQPFIHKNFEEIFFNMATHDHSGEDSSDLSDVFIQNLGTLQSGATFYVSSGTVTDLHVGSIKFPDGTVQVSSPAATAATAASKSLYQRGLTVFNNAASNTTKVDIEFNEIMVESVLLGDGVSVTTVTVDITTAGVGGLDIGSKTVNTWYAIYLIANSTGGYSAIVSTSDGKYNQPVLPPTYTMKRRVGGVRNDTSSTFRQFVRQGNRTMYLDNVVETYYEYTASNLAHSDNFFEVGLTTGMPPWAIHATLAFAAEADTDNVEGITIRPKGSSWPSSSATFHNHAIVQGSVSGGGVIYRLKGRAPISTDRNQKIEVRVGFAAGTTNNLRFSIMDYEEEY